MRKILAFWLALFMVAVSHAQLNPAITSWLQNTTVTARHYVSGNSTALNDADLVNVQKVQYSANYSYITTTGLPSYITGPFLDNNPSVATNQNAIFRFPLNPVQNTGAATNTTGGNIGVFINGVALFDYRDGVAWNNTTQALCGGPGRTACPGGPGSVQAWNRDAILAERGGFDCSKAHPAMGNYHHHQNPSAFKLDLNVLSTICNLYNADGLYVIDSNMHSPLIGFAYDGFPVYGAYGYKNADGSGGIVRIKSSYSLNTGTTRTNGPAVSTTYPLGYFREDYHYTATSAATPDYLDVHNGRFCVTPDYPSGIYCYFATVDANWNSAYPYVVGPTFYGTRTAAKVTSITEPVTTYTPVVLAIGLSSFYGVAKNNYNKLYWETSSELNNKYFAIERSVDGFNFSKIGTINGAGNSNISRAYSFTDMQPLAKRSYYRLIQVDDDGKFSYTKVISIHKNSSLDNAIFSVYPNPSNDFITVQINDMVKEDYHVVLYDIAGRLVSKTVMYQGSTIVFFDTKTLYSGTYLIRMSNSNSSFTKKVVIKKD